ncbi:protein indeterminate-domain 16-like [Phoenix dactylifera]|uniref:Protein indeterminate-domain 16-like n=1 Tax=Phoenix dactylifera TaxID=42345 RepID=A0A8B7CUE2_PHODC|nr:protein indeterminate-domain 16-like [Phoenix dactylifera]
MLGSPSPAPPQPLSINTSSNSSIHPQQPFPPLCNANASKKKRRPAGTPDPDAEVVSLSPRTLLESDRYVCEICNQGFQRDQNLQMHRRRHKVPWKLLKREATEARKRVFVCPEPSCLHHDPCHALGDLVGIKKHFRRKHSNHRQWVCAKCSKAYAVQSDYKAHLKTCGTRGHSCDCGRVFSRVESFIEHQDACNAGRARAELQTLQPACLSRTASSPSRSNDTNFSQAGWPGLPVPNPATIFLHSSQIPSLPPDRHCTHHIELRLLPPSNTKSPSLPSSTLSPTSEEAHAAKLQLSIGPSGDRSPDKEPGLATMRFEEEAREQVRLAMAEKALADEARHQAKRQIELAEQEFSNAKRIRHQAQVEINRAHALRDHAVKQINSTLLQITCYACKQQFQAKPMMASDDNSLVASYMSSVVTEGEEENDDQNQQQKIFST